MISTLLTYYLLAINAAGFLFMLVDKQRARRGAWRIPESTLLRLAAAGGSAGILAGIYAFRHKTRHRKFTLGVPLILAVQVALIGAILGNF